MLVLFACVAAFSIFFPELLTRVAHLMGIGRGTDLVLYGLVVSFLVFMATTYQRFRHMEAALTKLSRRIALDEVALPGSREEPPTGILQPERRLTPPAMGDNDVR
jgi:hypothetical protein